MSYSGKVVIQMNRLIELWDEFLKPALVWNVLLIMCFCLFAYGPALVDEATAGSRVNAGTKGVPDYCYTYVDSNEISENDVALISKLKDTYQYVYANAGMELTDNQIRNMIIECKQKLNNN